MNLQNIPVEKLVHHPQNPRKDIGDITELSDSIKAKGILQNLTVVPAGDKYYVVIGNRRMEAAKAAGLKTLPCVIAEMDEKEQMETMLLENIQRVDLTVKEQADGFQLMMDLGLTVEELSEKTGFAKSTIYHRLNVAKLDGDVLERKQVSMKQLIELEKIKSVTKRNEILANYGDSPNFSYQVKYAAEEEKAEEAKEKIIKLVEAAGIPKSKKYKYGWEYGFETLQRIRYRGETAEIPEQIESGEFYITDGSNVIIGKEIDEEREKTPEEIKKEKAREERRKKKKQAEELETSIKRKVVKIVTEFILSPKELSLSEEERKTLVIYSCGKSDEIPEAVPDTLRLSEMSAEGIDESDTIDSVLKKNPDTILLIACSGMPLAFRDFFGERTEDTENFEQIVEILKKYGLRLTPEEQALVDGTSELYEEAEE